MKLFVKFLILACSFFIATNISAQNKDTTIVVRTNPKDSLDKIFSIVQQPAAFIGGTEGWRQYLEKNLNVDLGVKYIKIPKGQKTGKVTVVIAFVVNKEGQISDVIAESTILDKVHPAFVKEAIRVIKEGPSWIPAKQNGRLVIYRHKQSISWVVNEE